MKRILLFLIALTSVIFAEGLITYTSYDKALKVAKEEHKLILFASTNESCPVCQYMKDIVLERPFIIDYLNANYAVVIKDVEKDAIPKQFRTLSVPTFFFIDPTTEQEVRKPKVGGAMPEKFLSELKTARERGSQ